MMLVLLNRHFEVYSSVFGISVFLKHPSDHHRPTAILDWLTESRAYHNHHKPRNVMFLRLLVWYAHQIGLLLYDIESRDDCQLTLCYGFHELNREWFQFQYRKIAEKLPFSTVWSNHPPCASGLHKRLAYVFEISSLSWLVLPASLYQISKQLGTIRWVNTRTEWRIGYGYDRFNDI
jgi:hypothetical protein